MTEDSSAPGRLTKRTEIVVERRFCTIEIHGLAVAMPDGRCPVCGSVMQLSSGQEEAAQ